MRLNSLFFLFSDIFDSYFWNQVSRISDSTLFVSLVDLEKLLLSLKPTTPSRNSLMRGIDSKIGRIQSLE